MSPIRDMNDMGSHDGTNQQINFGGPYDLRVMLNGDDLGRVEVKKGDTLYVSYAPTGETE